MFVLLLAVLLVVAIAMDIAMLLARWRPGWSYLKVAVLESAPIPIVVTVGSLIWAGTEALGVAFVTLPLFVVGAMSGAVGAWSMPRLPAPLIDADEIETIFK